MLKATGKCAGRMLIRPRCGRVGDRHQLAAIPHFIFRRYESEFNLAGLDGKWRAKWDTDKAQKKLSGARTESRHESKGKMYILPMFPYPSGDLHLGHLRVYTISDVLSRFRRMQGYDVMHPIGWDAFGLPAENAAIERGIDPASWTKENIKKMKEQLILMNGHWDWDREFATCDPNFYKHTQQLFILLHKAGLVYRAESLVNYDPVDKTVLANEQVDANGFSWRSGAKVEKRMLKQWFLKISQFRQELLDGLEELSKDGAWPEKVLAMQKNWLGKSTGARIKFKVIAYNQQTHSDVEVFTSRPDTLFGVQYLALASTHPIVQSLARTDVELQAFLDTIPSLPPDSKVGYLLPHVRAVNPLAYAESTPDATKESLPIYVAPYVLGDYGGGAVMGVPGHDIRDHAFWKHNRYDDPVRLVISESSDGSTTALTTEPYVHHGRLTHHSGPFVGNTSAEAKTKIVALLESNDLGSPAETWRLRDWLISRQRYWGTPIPIIHCESCGPLPVPEDQLPVELPNIEGHWGYGKAGNPLDHAHDWVNTKCPSCGGAAKRDTDTMDTFVDSSWYFMRFPDPNNKDLPFSPDAANENLPVDIYIGGVEHAILHLLYARFISKFMATTEFWPEGPKHRGEPFKQIVTQGMVHGKTYLDPSNGRFLKPDEVDLRDPSNPVVISTGEKANVTFEKMSKSKYNGVDPGACMAKHGADATRAHILFQAPVSDVLEWDEDRIAGITRWLRRLHQYIVQKSQAWSEDNSLEATSPKTLLIERVEEVHELRGMLKGVKQQLKQIDKESSEMEQKGFLGRLTSLPLYTLNEKFKHVFRGVSDGSIDESLAWFDREKRLWRAVQATIDSVTESYSKTYSLNTIVSDLMTLTNTIIETDAKGVLMRETVTEGIFPTGYFPEVVEQHATATLLKMMAPITPAFAEECWSLLSAGMKNKGSIFEQSFPEADGMYDMLTPDTQACAVQVNGKLKFTVEIPLAEDGMQGQELEDWVLEEIKSAEGGEKLEKWLGTGEVKRVIVVRGGKIVNFVMKS